MMMLILGKYAARVRFSVRVRYICLLIVGLPRASTHVVNYARLYWAVPVVGTFGVWPCALLFQNYCKDNIFQRSKWCTPRFAIASHVIAQIFVGTQASKRNAALNKTLAVLTARVDDIDRSRSSNTNALHLENENIWILRASILVVMARGLRFISSI